jgi:hypothetical protein
MTSRTASTQPSARRTRYVLLVARCLELDAHSTGQIITVWGMRCVGYDWQFESHLATSLKSIIPPSTPPSKKRKQVTKGSGSGRASEDDKDGRTANMELDISPSSKCPRAAKDKAKDAKHDWYGEQNSGDSDDEDYVP